MSKELYDKLKDEISNSFRSLIGRASVVLLDPINECAIASHIIKKYIAANNNPNIIVVVNEFKNRLKLIDELKEIGVSKDVIKILSKDYINPKFPNSYDLCITIGMETYYRTLCMLSNNSRHYLHIFKTYVFNSELNDNLHKLCKSITISVNPNSIIVNNIFTPVEEHQIGVCLSTEDKEEYDKHTDYINQSMGIFGEFYNIEKCITGDIKTGESASQFRTNLAIANGWGENLDMSYEFNRQIDSVYNPNSLLERASVFRSIIPKRKLLLTDNVAKLNATLDIIKDNIDKKILIISKRGEFANTIAKHIKEHNIDCGEYHDSIPEAIAIDINGRVIRVKSGKNKGEPKVIKSKAQSTNNEIRFNSGDINILSIKNSSDNSLEVSVDIVIITTPYCDKIFDIKKRFSNVSFSGDSTIIYVLYCNETNEVSKLTKVGENGLISIISDSDNFYIDDDNYFE